MAETAFAMPKLEMNRRNATIGVVLVILVAAAIIALLAARSVLAPIDRFVTGQACTTYGRDTLSREALEWEPSNRFSLTNRVEGHCIFGPVVEFDDENNVIETEESIAATEAGETLTLTIPEIETSGLYRAIKVMFVILQLGAASAAVRILGDPLLDRFVRRRRTPRPGPPSTT